MPPGGRQDSINSTFTGGLWGPACLRSFSTIPACRLRRTLGCPNGETVAIIQMRLPVRGPSSLPMPTIKHPEYFCTTVRSLGGDGPCSQPSTGDLPPQSSKWRKEGFLLGPSLDLDQSSGVDTIRMARSTLFAVRNQPSNKTECSFLDNCLGTCRKRPGY